MTSGAPFIEELRLIAAQEASIPGLRGLLFLLGVLAATAWWNRRPRLALLLLSLGGGAGLSYWLVQVASPLGLDVDPQLTRDWAQAGVNAFAEPHGSGFVWGAEAAPSLVGWLAAQGVPLPVVHRTPQLAALLGLLFTIALPMKLIGNRSTAAFAACLCLGGGLWPGVSPYDALLRRPSLLFVIVSGLVLGWLAARRPTLRRWAGRRPWIILGMFAAAALDSTAIGLVLLSLVLSSPLRALLRALGGTAAAVRGLEALVILISFSGSGLFWWNPAQTVPGFVESRSVETALRRPLDWMAGNVPNRDVILTSPTYSAAVAAFAGRRVLVPPPGEGAQTLLREPFRRARLKNSVLQGAPIAHLSEAFSLTHLFLGPGEPNPPIPVGADPSGEPRLRLVLVYEDAEDFRVFRLAKK